VRSAHLDADRRQLLVCFGFPHRYSPSTPPSWVEVSFAGGGP
jgi:hypothetical protein